MRWLRAIDGLRGSSEPLSSGLSSDYTAVVTERAYDCAQRGCPDVVGSAGLVATGLAPGRVDGALPFEGAAVLCGHDPTTSTGAADARHDSRVWDLLDQIRTEGANA